MTFTFYNLTSGLRNKMKSNSGLFECQFHEIEENANTIGNVPASTNIIKLEYLFVCSFANIGNH